MGCGTSGKFKFVGVTRTSIRSPVTFGDGVRDQE
jgi:hypothetical protein